MKNPKNDLGVNWTSVLALLGIALMIPIFSGNNQYVLSVVTFMLIYIIAVSGLDILYGYSGQISLGHAAFYAIGAYGSALMHNYWGIPILITIFLSAILAAMVAALLAYPASKLVFHFLSLTTIAFGEIVYQFLMNSPNRITGNAVGIFTEKLTIFGVKFDHYKYFFIFSLVCTVIFLAAKIFLLSGKTGRAFMAIRENTHAAAGMGINVRKYKVAAFATSAFFTAFAGAMYMHIVGFVFPDMFMQKQSVLFLTMLLFGGSGSLMGPIIGTIIVMLTTEALREFQEFSALLYAILLLIAIIALPGGVYGAVKKLISRKRFMKNENQA